VIVTVAANSVTVAIGLPELATPFVTRMTLCYVPAMACVHLYASVRLSLAGIELKRMNGSSCCLMITKTYPFHFGTSCERTSYLLSILPFPFYHFPISDSVSSVSLLSYSHTVRQMRVLKLTRSSSTADGPRDALCQSKSCQLLHNCKNKSYNRCYPQA